MSKNYRNIGIFMEQFGLGGTDVQLANLINNWPVVSDEITYITNQGNKGLTLFKSLLKRKCKISVIELKSFDYYNQKLIQSKLPSKIKIALKYLILLFRYPLLLLDILRLSRIFRKYSFDVIISDNGGYPGSDSCRAAVFAAWLCRIRNRYALIHHEAQPIEKLFYFIERFIDKYLQKLVKAVITVSEASAQSLLVRGFFSAKLKVIYNGIEDNVLSGRGINIRSKYGIDTKKKIVGLMGNVEYHKGHQVMINAAPMIIEKWPETLFIFIGSFYDENWQRNYADKVLDSIRENKLQDHIIMTGYLECHPLDLINQFDILVMPTLDFEGFGLVLAEAMILKKPIIASRVGAIPEVIINEESGLLIPPGEPEALAKAVIILLTDREKACKLAANARQRYERYFTAKIMAKKYYEEICKK